MTIFMVTLNQTLHLQQIRNVFYYETTVGDPSGAEWIDIADEIRGDYDDLLDPRLAAEWSFDSVDYRVVDSAGLPTLTVVPTAGSIVGTSAVDTIPTQVAMLLIVKGATTKPRQARTFMGGFDVNSVLNSVWTAGARAAAESFIDEMSGLNAAGTNPLQRVAVQWNASHTLVTVSNNIAAVASVASLVPATQRRRRIGVGI